MPYLFDSIQSYLLFSSILPCNQLPRVGRTCKYMSGTWCPWCKAYRSRMGWLCSLFGEREHCSAIYPQSEGSSSIVPNKKFSLIVDTNNRLTVNTTWFGMCIRNVSTNQGLTKGSSTRMILASMFLLQNHQVVLLFSSFNVHHFTPLCISCIEKHRIQLSTYLGWETAWKSFG